MIEESRIEQDMNVVFKQKTPVSTEILSIRMIAIDHK